MLALVEFEAQTLGSLSNLGDPKVIVTLFPVEPREKVALDNGNARLDSLVCKVFKQRQRGIVMVSASYLFQGFGRREAKGIIFAQVW